MPEQISKYPDVTLKVLKGAGAVCGEGAPQQILTHCPAESFCSLSTGEICVYGIEQIPQMTQITRQELAQVVCPISQHSAAFPMTISGTEGIWLVAVFLAGLTLGNSWKKFRVK
jgi:hypothetical protein